MVLQSLYSLKVFGTTHSDHEILGKNKTKNGRAVARIHFLKLKTAAASSRLILSPPYSPQLNLAETVWRMLKGKWLQPFHYCDKTLLHESTRRILSEIGTLYKINFSYAA